MIDPADSRFASKMILVLRALLATMSFAALLGWSYITLGAVAWGAIVLPSIFLGILFGYVYLLLSIYLSLKNPPIHTITELGVALNLVPVVYFIYVLLHIEDKLSRAAFVPMGFVFVWLLLLLFRWFTFRNVSPARQILTIFIVFASATVSLAALMPLTIDPYSEAARLSEAGARTRNPEEAKRLFAQAHKQANRIKNPYGREQPLGVVAYNQAKAGLIQDAEATANKCTSEGARKIAYNYIVRGQLESGDLRGAVVTAKSYDSGEALFMTLRDIAIARAQAGQTESAKEITRFAEQTAQDPAFESLARWSFAYLATAQAQLGLHDEALSSARKTGDEYAPEQMASIAITEKQAGYAEQSRASVQEAIRGVMALRKDISSRDSSLYELANRLSDSGLFDEARMVADSIQSESTRAFLFRSMDHARARSAR